MDWERLQASCMGCTACDLSKRRTRVVFGEGDRFSPLVLVGEGPGEQEDQSGRPFVGRAGKLLDQALVDAGLSRESVYITNTVKCRAADWSSGKPVNRAPTERESETCRTWLIPQLELLSPEVILCVGAPSAKNLIRPDFAITKERGRYFPIKYAKTAIATLHPSYVLRQMNISGDQSYNLLVQDIAKAWLAAQRLANRGELEE